MNSDLLIFDCDGVLVDTERLQLSVLAAEVRQLGDDMSDEEALVLFRGGKMADYLRIINSRLAQPVPDDFEQKLRARWDVVFRAELQPIPGIAALLAQLNGRRCVASNGPKAKMALTLEVTGLSQFFDPNYIFSAYDIGHWKPDPRLYTFVAQAMQTPPSQCTVIEDSLVGVQAAVAAGMRVFGFAEDGQDSELAAAGAIVFHEMSELPELLNG